MKGSKQAVGISEQGVEGNILSETVRGYTTCTLPSIIRMVMSGRMR
jgi:hypothetical protein